MKDIREIASILDETIEKSMKVKEPKRIRKSLSFDPLKPIPMSPNTNGIYNPYRFADDGFAPYDSKYWMDMGKNKGYPEGTTSDVIANQEAIRFDGYRESDKFLRQAGVFRSMMYAELDGIKKGSMTDEERISRTRHYLRKENVIRKSRFPVGTIHEWNGLKFQKQAEGKWVPVHEGAQKDHPIEKDAQKKRENLKKILGDRKTGIAKEPSFEDKAKQATQRALEVQQKDTEISQQEHDQRGRELDMREKELGMREAALKGGKEKSQVKESGTSGKEKSQVKESGTSGKDSKSEDLVGSEPDKVDNGLSPPPPENQKFMKPGNEVSIDDVSDFIDKFEGDFKQLTVMNDQFKQLGATHFASRLKDKQSLFGKMKDRYKDMALNNVGDVIGARVLAKSVEDQKRIFENIPRLYNVVKSKDSSEKARDDGYRAIHFSIKTPSGKTAELQLKTHFQQIFSGFTHDQIYKGIPDIKKSPEVNNYVKELSDHLHAMDKGEKVGDRPKEPPILLKHGIEFPWDAIDEFGAEAMAKVNVGKVKFYAVVRSEAKENEEIVEFNSFKDAKSFRQKKWDMGHKGELPIGYAESKEEFVDTFSEYRPKEKVTKSSWRGHLSSLDLINMANDLIDRLNGHDGVTAHRSNIKKSVLSGYVDFLNKADNNGDRDFYMDKLESAIRDSYKFIKSMEGINHE